MKNLLLFSFIALSTSSYAQSFDLWGVTASGGPANGGLVYKVDSNASSITTVKHFQKSPGSSPQYEKLCVGNNGKLYGMTNNGGKFGRGMIYEYDPVSNTYVKKIDFNSTNGSGPTSYLIRGNNGKLYGMTPNGGINFDGVIFEYNDSTNVITKLFDFDRLVSGGLPYGALLQASNGKLYGMTRVGGSLSNSGVLFEFDIATNVYTKKITFNATTSGRGAFGSLIEGNNGKLYGMTREGGTSNEGVLFEYDPVANTHAVKVNFAWAVSGSRPYGDLTLAANGKLYGMTPTGGAFSGGVLFEYDLATSTFTKRFDFRSSIFHSAIDGEEPYGSLVESANGKLYGMCSKGGVNGDGTLFSFDTLTNTLTKQIDFDVIQRGSEPLGTLTELSPGIFYGVSRRGGNSYISGALFEFNDSTSSFTRKIDFNSSTEGHTPAGSLFQASNGKVYGTCSIAGQNGSGVFFEIDPLTQAYTKRIDFDNTLTGRNPVGKLLQASNGKIYGVTKEGGTFGAGTIFEYDPTTNNISKKFDFNSGIFPIGGLIEVGNGKLYGMTQFGGTLGYGTLFEFDVNTNAYTRKLSFNSSIGSSPLGPLLEGRNGELYGLTSRGGTSNEGVLFEYNSIRNTFTKLYDFTATSGRYPMGALIFSSSGTLLGLTSSGGAHSAGTIFEYDTAISTFTKKIDLVFTGGSNPRGSLLKAQNGKYYGVTPGGGSHSVGTLFEYSLSTNTYIKKIDFDTLNGTFPVENLIEVDYTITAIPSEHDISSKKLVFPNPTNGLITISGINRNTIISIYDLKGRQLSTHSLEADQQLNLSNLTKGVYLIRIDDYVEKLIISR